MERESEISTLLKMDRDICTLALDIQAEEKYLEDVRSKLQSDAQKCKKAREQLPKVEILLKKHLAKVHKAPALIKNERWARAVNRISEVKENYTASLQKYDQLLAHHTKHENILCALKNEYTERVRRYTAQSEYTTKLNAAHILSPEELSQAKETFLNCTFPLPRVSK